jgi:hypothetical protein
MNEHWERRESLTAFLDVRLNLGDHAPAGRPREMGSLACEGGAVAAMVQAGALLINHIAPGSFTVAPST